MATRVSTDGQTPGAQIAALKAAGAIATSNSPSAHGDSVDLWPRGITAGVDSVKDAHSRLSSNPLGTL